MTLLCSILQTWCRICKANWKICVHMCLFRGWEMGWGRGRACKVYLSLIQSRCWYLFLWRAESEHATCTEPCSHLRPAGPSHWPGLPSAAGVPTSEWPVQSSWPPHRHQHRGSPSQPPWVFRCQGAEHFLMWQLFGFISCMSCVRFPAHACICVCVRLNSCDANTCKYNLNVWCDWICLLKIDVPSFNGF